MRGSEPSSPADSAIARLLATFVVSYVFYLALGDPTDPFDLVTGALAAGVVAAAFGGVAFRESPAAGRTTGRILRGVAFLPGLLWEIGKANVSLAAVVLDPRLPVDPAVVSVDVTGRSAVERTVLASAITLTPGTVVLDARDDEFRVHALTAASREEIRGGRLQRSVAGIFGRGGDRTVERARSDSNRDRDRGDRG
jgi:multicomponent Na+:H+ antiporter subunit E